MILYIDGSDIRRLILATAEETRVYDIGPEGYLAAVDEMLQSKTLTGIMIVQGPGSATALRASLAIANTLAFTQGTPLHGVAKGVSFDDALHGRLPLPAPQSFLAPIYESDAHITTSNKDQLRRTQ